MARRRFDQNNNRVDYGELLIEDPVFELEQAVGMTYSLDMEALMGIPLCLGMRGEMTSGQRNTPLYVLEAIRRTGNSLFFAMLDVLKSRNQKADYLHYWRTVFMRFVCLRVHITSIQNYGFYSIAMSTMAEL